MTALLDGIKQNSFLVIGRAGMDFFPDPPGTKTEEATEFRSGLGGSAANTAAGICRFGGKADLVTCVSDDSIGRYCVNQLKHYGVGHQFVRPVGGEFRNSLAVYETRVEDHQTVIYRNGAADFQMNVDDVEALDYASYGALITAGTVFAAEPSRSAAFRAFELAREAGLPIIFDIDYRPYSWPSPQVAEDVLSRAGEMADMIVGNDEEFGFMAGDIAKGQAKAQALAESTASIVIYKMGEKGAVTYAGGDIVTTGIFKVEALKPTGAGDSFMAGLMAAIAAGFDLKDAIHRGSACAAIVVGKPGCAPALPDLTELETFLTTHPGPTAA
ncbi:MAG: 5-dehydro-2-deoxygluconokinase [Pseudomonadota bacterium]